MQQALDFLRNHNEVAFATSDGHLPKLRIFQIMRQDGTMLYFSTSPQKQVYKELKSNPNIELLAFADHVSLRCSGAVSFEVSDDIQRWIFDHNPVLPRLYTSYDHLVYFSLNITEMDYYDLRPTPPLFKHFNLISGEVGNGYVGERYSKNSLP